MIYLSLLFWAGLALPGIVAIRYLDPDSWKAGLLGVLGLAYVASCALLAPVSVACYLLHLPVAVFASASIALIIAAVIELTRRGWWRDVAQLVKGAVGVEALLLLAVLVLAARVGTISGDPTAPLGDAAVHLARVRQLLDDGFTNTHPYVAGGYFFSMYHTNLLHSLMAACAWVTRVDYLGVWFVSLPLAELLVASGCYYLAWCIFERRWVAWVAALFFLATQGTVTFLIYPNKLAPFWLIPILIGLVIRATMGRGESSPFPCRWRHVVWIAAGVVVTSLFHGLYGLFAVLLLGPLLGAYALLKLIRRAPDRWPQLACAGVLALALPAPLISRISAFTCEGNEARATTAEMSSAGFVTLANGWSVKNPLEGFGDRHGLRLCLLTAGIVAALLSKRRPAAARATVVVLAAAAAFYVPPLCTLLLRVAGSNWILARLEAIFFVSFAALVPATVAYWIEPKTRFAWVRALLSLGAFAIALPYGGGHLSKSWADFLSAASRPAEARQARLVGLRAMRQFFSTRIPAGQTILIEDSLGSLLVMLCDCHVVSPIVATGGVPDLKKRWQDNARMLSDRTDWAERQALLRQYGIRYYVPAGPLEWPRQHARNVWTLDQPRVRVIELSVD